MDTGREGEEKDADDEDEPRGGVGARDTAAAEREVVLDAHGAPARDMPPKTGCIRDLSRPMPCVL